MPKTQAQKEAQKRYVDKNRDKINAKVLVYVKNQYAVKRDEILKYKKDYYAMKKICQIFRNILIDDISVENI